MSKPHTTFFPGPSQLNANLGQYLQDAVESGILSASHRSKAFDALSAETVALLHDRLAIPADYRIYYTTSATESWEIIPQSLTERGGLHIYTGSFGQKWSEYAQKIRPESTGLQYAVNDSIDWANLPLTDSHELICITQNETSNGTQVNAETIKQIRSLYPELLLAVDVTSSINGISLPFADADIWYGSVQKCFGMPAGLGMLICSPRALARAQSIGDRKHYNSLLVLEDNMAKFQTTCTPNVLGIYLLNRILTTSPNVIDLQDTIMKRANQLYQLLDDSTGGISPLVTNSSNRSTTVQAISCEPELMVKLKSEASEAGFLLGNGYGKWKESTFRVANFPAISETAWQQMIDFLSVRIA